MTFEDDDDSYAAFQARRAGASAPTSDPADPDDSYDEFNRRKKQDALAAERAAKRAAAPKGTGLPFVPAPPPPVQTGRALSEIPASEWATRQAAVPAPSSRLSRMAGDVTASMQDQRTVLQRVAPQNAEPAGPLGDLGSAGRLGTGLVYDQLAHPVETARSLAENAVTAPWKGIKYAAAKGHELRTGEDITGNSYENVGEIPMNREALMTGVDLATLTLPAARTLGKGVAGIGEHIGEQMAVEAAKDARFPGALERARAEALDAREVKQRTGGRLLGPGQYDMPSASFTTRDAPEADASRLLPERTGAQPTEQYGAPAGPGIAARGFREVPETEPSRLIPDRTGPQPREQYAGPAGPGIAQPAVGARDMAARAAEIRAQRDQIMARPADVENYQLERDVNVNLRDRAATAASQADERAAIQDEQRKAPYSVPFKERDFTLQTPEGKFIYPRTRTGALRPNLANVDDDGLFNELAELTNANINEKGNIFETATTPFGEPDTIKTTRQPESSVKASGRFKARDKAITRIKTELEGRGHDAQKIEDAVWAKMGGPDDPTYFGPPEGQWLDAEEPAAAAAPKENGTEVSEKTGNRPGYVASGQLGLLAAPGLGAAAGAAVAPEGERKEGAAAGAVMALGLAAIGARGLRNAAEGGADAAAGEAAIARAKARTQGAVGYGREGKSSEALWRKNAGIEPTEAVTEISAKLPRAERQRLIETLKPDTPYLVRGAGGEAAGAGRGIEQALDEFTDLNDWVPSQFKAGGARNRVGAVGDIGKLEDAMRARRDRQITAMELGGEPSDEFLASRKQLGDANKAAGEAQRAYVRGQMSEADYTATKTKAAELQTAHETLRAGELQRIEDAKKVAGTIRPAPEQQGDMIRDLIDRKGESLESDATDEEVRKYGWKEEDIKAGRARDAASKIQPDHELGGDAFRHAVGGAAVGASTAAAGDTKDGGDHTTAMIIGALGVGAAGFIAGRKAMSTATKVGRDLESEISRAGRRLGADVTPRMRMDNETPGLRVDRLSPKPAPKVPAGDIDPNEFANLSKFALDETGEERLAEQVKKVVAENNLSPKRVVSWDETKKAGATLGLAPEDLLRNQKLSGAEMLAIRNIVKGNIERVADLEGRLATDGTLSDDQRTVINRAIQGMDGQNDALLGKFTKERSRTGRDLNNLKILAQQTTDPVVWLARAKRFLKDAPLTDEIRTEITRLTNAGDSNALAKYVADLQPSTTWDKLRTVWQAGLLTAPTTHMANALGNTTMAFLERAKDVPATVLDRLLGTVTGMTTKTVSMQGMAQSAAEGAIKGVRQARRVLKGEIAGDLSRLNVKEVNYDNAILNGYTKSVFRSLSASDQVFRQLALKQSIDEQARVMAKIEGWKGKAFDARVTALKAQPSDEMAVRALEAAEYATFQDSSPIAKAALGFRRALGPVGEVVLPFARTPGNVAMRTFEYTPAGALLTIKDLGALLKGAGTEDTQRKVVEQLGRSSIGAAALYAGYQLAADGNWSGQHSSSAATRETKNLEGRPDNAVQVGDRWYTVTRVSPLGNLIAVGAALHELGANPALSPIERGAAGVAAVGKSVLDQPFVTGLTAALDAVKDPMNAGGDYLRQLGTSIVPAIVQRGVRAVSPTIREEGGATPAEQIAGRAGINRSDIPVKRDVLGQPATREGGARAMFDPFDSRRDVTKDDPLIAEVARVGAEIGPVKRLKGEDAKTFSNRMGKEGPVLRRVLEHLFAAPGYRQLEQVAAQAAKQHGGNAKEIADELQRTEIENTVRRVRAQLTTVRPKAPKPKPVPR